MQEAILEPGFSGIALLAGRKTHCSHTVRNKIPAPSMNHDPLHYNHHGSMQGGWGTAWCRDVLTQQYLLPPSSASSLASLPIQDLSISVLYSLKNTAMCKKMQSSKKHLILEAALRLLQQAGELQPCGHLEVIHSARGC